MSRDGLGTVPFERGHLMTDSHDEAELRPNTREIPIVPPVTIDWRQPAVVRPLEEVEQFGATQALAAQTTPDSPTEKLRKPPFRNVRFTYDGSEATATHYVNVGEKRDKDFRAQIKTLDVAKNGAVDTNLIPTLDFIPEDEETEIRYLERRHWMYFGRVLIPNAIFWATVWVLYVCYDVDHYLGGIGLAMFAMWLVAWLVAVGIAVLQWHCVIFLMTNSRLHCIRAYPLINLPVLDQHLGAMSETTINPVRLKFLANHGFDFAKLTASVVSSGKESEWLTKKGLSFMQHPRVLQSITRPS